LDEVGDLLIIGSEILELDECLDSLSPVTERDLCLRVEPEDLRIVRILLQVGSSIGVDIL
jgi:hypothetical protein